MTSSEKQLQIMGGASQEKLKGQNVRTIGCEWKEMFKRMSENVDINRFFINNMAKCQLVDNKLEKLKFGRVRKG